MELWKIGVIAAIFVSVLGIGLYNQNLQTQTPTPTPAPNQPTPTPIAARFLGVSLGSPALPSWDNITQWTNTPAPVKLDSLKGQVALIEVFRINCGHCSDAAPFLEALYEKYKGRGFKIVGIQSPGQFDDPENLENKWPEVQKWLKERNVKYPIGFDEKSAWFQGKVKGTNYPTMLLAGQNGTIEFAQTGFDAEKAINLTIAVEKALLAKEKDARTEQQIAQDLAKFLAPFLRIGTDASLQKALADDIARRMSE